MPVMIALLRGVNVGGSAPVAMADVRHAVSDCGYDNVQTYVQSGNVVFSTTSRNTETVAERLRTALAQATTVQPDVVVRTREELQAVVRDNPYQDRAANVTQLHVVFVSGTGDASLAGLDLPRFLPEEAHARGRNIYLYLPNGAGRSKLSAAIARRKGPAVTMRNWRTVTTLVELASAVR